MSAFSLKVAELAGIDEQKIERLSGGDLSEVLRFHRVEGRAVVAKGGPAVATEAGMLRALASAGMPVPMIEAEHEHLLLLEYIANDAIFSPSAWGHIGQELKRLHGRTGPSFGWPIDYRIGTVELDNRQSDHWPRFWAEQRLVPTASLLDRPWREKIERLAGRIADFLPASPAASHLHGDLWSGNILVSTGKLAALIDPACYYGHAEVDLAMLSLFDSPPPEFWEAYGALDPGWEERRPLYQLFPALLHLRLFGASYATLVDRLLAETQASATYIAQ